MNFAVLEVVGLVGGGAKSDVALIVYPDPKGLEISQQYPLPDVELPLLYDKRILDVLLCDPGNLLADNVVKNLSDFIECFDTSAPGQAGGLDYPNIVSIQIPLRIYLISMLAYFLSFAQQNLVDLHFRFLSYSEFVIFLDETPFCFRYE